MAWVNRGLIPMFPYYFDIGVGSAVLNGSNPRTKWKVVNTSNRELNVRVSIKGSQGVWEENRYFAQYTIPANGEWRG